MLGGIDAIFKKSVARLAQKTGRVCMDSTYYVRQNCCILICVSELSQLYDAVVRQG
jgi:hypothetical protein